MNTAVRSLERARDWLDERGRAAWIAAHRDRLRPVLADRTRPSRLYFLEQTHELPFLGPPPSPPPRAMGRTGNTAFDAYREETLKRLEEERDAFVQLPRAAARGQGPGGVRPVHVGPPGARARLTHHGSEQAALPRGAAFSCAADHPGEDAVAVDELMLERGPGVERQQRGEGERGAGVDGVGGAPRPRRRRGSRGRAAPSGRRPGSASAADPGPARRRRAPSRRAASRTSAHRGARG